ncbi:MAG: TonB-dependent receptor [Rhodoferax sp.]|nr:TonB-dependent receptor [Rhodoferax sp.]
MKHVLCPRLIAALLGAAALWGGSTQAQSPAPVVSAGQLSETVVTANRSEQLVTDAMPHTTVIGRDVIERSQAPDLPTLLASEAGFQFTQSGGRGTATNLFLRGSAALQVLVLVDGVPMTKQDATGTVSLEHLMLDQVERVEVVRGNVSAIYGSGAIGGVIQVFTRQGQGAPRGYGQLELGPQGSLRATTGVRGQVGQTRFAIGVGHQQTDGFSAMNTQQYPNENPDADGYRNSNLALSLSHELADGHTVGARVHRVEAAFDADGGGFGGATDRFKGRSDLESWTLYSHNRLSANWRSELTLGSGREASVYDARLTAFPYDSEAVSRSRSINWTHSMVLGDWLLNAGFEYQSQSIGTRDSTASTLDRDRGVRSVFAGLAGGLNGHALQVNVRRDASDGLDPQTTGYVGYGYNLTPAWKLLASVSTAFNLPPLGYLYDPFSGNPALKPEQARSRELGVQWAVPGQVLRATWFSTSMTDMLLYDFGTFQFGNVSAATNRGLEVSYSGRIDRTDWRGSLTLQDPRDDSTGKTLVRRAGTMASVAVTAPAGAWTLGGDIRWTGARPDSPRPEDLPAYALVQLTARYPISPEWTFTTRIENLLDRQYQTAYGYNQPGRGLYAGLVWTQK